MLKDFLFYVFIDYQVGEPYMVLARTFLIKAKSEDEAIKIALDYNPEIGAGELTSSAIRIEFSNIDIDGIKIRNVVREYEESEE